MKEAGQTDMLGNGARDARLLRNHRFPAFFGSSRYVVPGAFVYGQLT